MRSFNEVKAADYERIGQSRACETHLVPGVLRPVLGTPTPLLVFGKVLVASGRKAHELLGWQRR